MALGSTIRNRIVGFLVIISIVLIALPAMMDNDAERREENNQAIAIDKNGAVTDENGQLMSNFEPDYATLLEDNSKDSSSGELSIKGDIKDNNLPSAADGTLHTGMGAAGSNSSYVDSTSPASGGSEVLIGSASSAQAAPATPAKPKPQPEVLGGKTTASSGTASSKVEVLGAKPAPKPVKTETASNTKVATGSFSVQVGVFEQKEKADKLIAKLKQGGVQAFSRNVKINGKNMIRVYAGSAKNRADLQPVLDKVSKITGSKGFIATVQ